MFICVNLLLNISIIFIISKSCLAYGKINSLTCKKQGFSNFRVSVRLSVGKSNHYQVNFWRTGKASIYNSFKKESTSILMILYNFYFLYLVSSILFLFVRFCWLSDLWASHWYGEHHHCFNEYNLKFLRYLRF